MTEISLRIRIAQSLAEVPAAAWNTCANQSVESSIKVKHEISAARLSTRGQVDNPFILHEFLSALEQSGSVGGRTGWQPRHLLAEDDKGNAEAEDDRAGAARGAPGWPVVTSTARQPSPSPKP